MNSSTSTKLSPVLAGAVALSAGLGIGLGVMALRVIKEQGRVEQRLRDQLERSTDANEGPESNPFQFESSPSRRRRRARARSYGPQGLEFAADLKRVVDKVRRQGSCPGPGGPYRPNLIVSFSITDGGISNHTGCLFSSICSLMSLCPS